MAPWWTVHVMMEWSLLRLGCRSLAQQGTSHAGIEATVEKVLGNENEEASPVIWPKFLVFCITRVYQLEAVYVVRMS